MPTWPRSPPWKASERTKPWSIRGGLGISQLKVAHYEGQGNQPPALLLPTIADAFSLAVAQLLARGPVSARKAPENQLLPRELRKVEKLPPHTRRSVLEYVDDLVTKYGAGGQERRARPKLGSLAHEAVVDHSPYGLERSVSVSGSMSGSLSYAESMRRFNGSLSFLRW